MAQAAASGTPDGSPANPYLSVADAIKSGKIAGGDTVILHDGEYGALVLKGLKFNQTVTFAAAQGEYPHLESLDIQKSTNVVVSGLSVWPSIFPTKTRPVVRIDYASTDITLSQLDIRSRPDATAYMNWPLTTWQGNKRAGIISKGRRVTLAGNTVTGAYMGIATIGAQSRVIGNRILGFSGDAMRGIGDNSEFIGNLARDCFKIDANHDDGFQSWSTGPTGKSGQGTLTGLVIESNVILEFTGTPNHPLRCKLQGIGMFDGMYKDVLIQNNVVAVGGYHGIAVAGGINLRVINNSVIDPKDRGKNFPWVSIKPHKNGTPTQNVVMSNNFAHGYQLTPALQPDVPRLRNVIVQHPKNELRDPDGGDFRPKDTSVLVDGALALMAPNYDIIGAARPLGRNPDVGAYEVK